MFGVERVGFSVSGMKKYTLDPITAILMDSTGAPRLEVVVERFKHARPTKHKF